MGLDGGDGDVEGNGEGEEKILGDGAVVGVVCLLGFRLTLALALVLVSVDVFVAVAAAAVVKGVLPCAREVDDGRQIAGKVSCG